MCPLGWRETPTALFLPSQFHLHEMPASSSSSTHISPQFNRRPNRSSISLAEEEQGKRLEIIYWLDHAHSIMRTKEDPKKAPKYLVTLREPGVKYRECRKNHAASIGGYAVDGCREFMAAGKEGTSAALKCAACSCHRSFHKREVEIDGLCDCSSISNSTSTPRK